MRSVDLVFFSLAALAAGHDENQIKLLKRGLGKRSRKPKVVPDGGTRSCNPQPLNAHKLVEKVRSSASTCSLFVGFLCDHSSGCLCVCLVSQYNLSISDPEHVAALSAAVNGRLCLGSTTSFIQEARDAGLASDHSLSGDTNWPYGGFKPLITVGEINMCEANHGEAVSSQKKDPNKICVLCWDKGK